MLIVEMCFLGTSIEYL